MSHLYHVSTIAKDSYEMAGRYRKHAENELNQMMSGAKMVGVEGTHRIFDSANKKWRLFLHKSEKVIEDVKCLEEISTEMPEIDGNFKLTQHAMKRVRERFGFPKMNDAQLESHLNDVLKVSTWHSETHNSYGMVRNYDARKQNMRIVVSMKERVIVTVYQLNEVSAKAINVDSPLFSKIAAVAKRELAKAGASFRKTQRELTAQMSAMKIELARAEVNLLNAKAPRVKNIIREKIENYTRSIDDLTAELGRKQGEFERVKKDAQALIGGGER